MPFVTMAAWCGTSLADGLNTKYKPTTAPTTKAANATATKCFCLIANLKRKENIRVQDAADCCWSIFIVTDCLPLNQDSHCCFNKNAAKLTGFNWISLFLTSSAYIRYSRINFNCCFSIGREFVLMTLDDKVRACTWKCDKSNAKSIAPHDVVFLPLLIGKINQIFSMQNCSTIKWARLDWQISWTRHWAELSLLVSSAFEIKRTQSTIVVNSELVDDREMVIFAFIFHDSQWIWLKCQHPMIDIQSVHVPVARVVSIDQWVHSPARRTAPSSGRKASAIWPSSMIEPQ